MVNHTMVFDRHGFTQSSRHSGGLTKLCGHIKTPSSTPQPYHYESSRRVPSILKSAFSVLDHVIFDTPLEVMLERPLRSKKHWIRLAQRYHPSTNSQKTGKQHLITTFFTRLVKIQKPRTTHLTTKKQSKSTRPEKKQPFTRSTNQNRRRQFHLAPD
jgi:hypothetical protein